MKKKYVFLLANLLLLIMLTNCQCQRSDLIVSDVVLELPDNLLKAAQTQQIDLKTLLKEALDNDPYFQVNPAQKDAGILNLSLMISRLDSEILLVANLVRKNQEQIAFAEIALSEVPDFEAEGLRKALTRSIAYLRQQLVDHNNNNSDVRYMLKLKEACDGENLDPEILTNALKLAGEKKDQQSLSYIIKLLGSTDNLGVAHACLLALAKLKDASALPAIIDFAENKPAIVRRQAIIAARQIPSKLSAEWLVVMAYGHEDPVVRKEALEGLSEVEKFLREQK